MPSLSAPRIALLALLFLSACATPPHSDDSATPERKPFVDPLSGITLPRHVESLTQVSINTDPDDKNPVSAHYTSSLIDAGVRIVPSTQTNPNQLLGQTIRSLQSNPNFIQTDYRGLRSFANQTAFCTQCAFDRPSSGRVIVKIVIVPRGNYLVCFTFVLPSTQEDAAQETVDAFIRAILAKSTGEVLMTPEAAPSESTNSTED